MIPLRHGRTHGTLLNAAIRPSPVATPSQTAANAADTIFASIVNANPAPSRLFFDPRRDNETPSPAPALLAPEPGPRSPSTDEGEAAPTTASEPHRIAAMQAALDLAGAEAEAAHLRKVINDNIIATERKYQALE